MSEIKVSVIVPVYNEELYLEKALQSIVDQTFKDYEVIIVNDGSTDNSKAIIDDFVKKYKNFCVITQKNSGLSVARNTGLEIAKGEYIAFLDSDDFWEPDFLKKMYSACKENDADISYCRFYIIKHNRQCKFYLPFILFHYLQGKIAVVDKRLAFKRLIRINTMFMFAWNKLYKREIFVKHNIRFPKNLYFEDVPTIPQLYLNANKVVVLRDRLCNYRRHEDSITNLENGNLTLCCKRINDLIRACGMLRDTLEKNKIFKPCRRSFIVLGIRCYIFNFIAVINLHRFAKNYKGMFKNIRNVNMSFKYVFGKSFQTAQGEVKVPYPVIIPKSK